MPERVFFEEDAKALATKAIQEIESQTSAEVVIALRKQSGEYRRADFLMGSVVAYLTLLATLFLPQSFTWYTIPIDVVLGFGLGVLISTTLPGVRRLLLPSRVLSEQVRVHALAAFVELGVTRTNLRNGVLVYVSMFERRARVVTDVGVDLEALGEAWTEAVGRVEAAVERTDYEAFLNAVKAFGPVLARQMPRSHDDVNELPDEVQ